jgi:hypothetical protein
MSMRIEEFVKKLKQTIDATATGYEMAVTDHMPECAYRNFCLWGISRQNPHYPAVMQLIGAVQSSNLTVRLLAGLTEHEKTWQRLLHASVKMNGWQLLEIVSDNLARGLARYGRTGYSRPDASRRALLRAFNTLMAKRLKDEISVASVRAAPYASWSGSCSDEVSLFRQHLAPLKLRSLAKTFINERGGTLSELEYAARSHLIANIEACVDVVGAVEIRRLRSLVRGSLIARYESVNRLLEPDELSLEGILDASTYTILVIPTLGYYISALAQDAGMEAQLNRLIDEETLVDALYDAALLVRLHNDVGVVLLTFDDSARLSFLRQIKARSRNRGGESLAELLTRIGKEYAPLNRIWKDACLGEFNVCLYGVGHAPFSGEILSAFGQRLVLCAKVYSAHKAKLASELLKINDRLKDNRISQIIVRFVRFHEQLYDGHYHDTIDGDYAVH